MVVLSLYKKTQIGYTQYVDNDVYVDDVDDDEAGAGAYFLFRHSDDHSWLTNGWIIRRVQCRGQACRLHAECYESQCRGIFHMGSSMSAAC